MNTLFFIIGGPQGAGLETSMVILGYSFARMGYGFIADREYFSNIKGRHSYIHVGVSSEGIPEYLDYPVSIVAGMDSETIFTHFNDLGRDGYLVYDEVLNDRGLDSIPSMEDQLRERLRKFFRDEGLEPVIGDLVKYLKGRGVNVIGLNYTAILGRVGEKYDIRASQLSRYLSSIVVGSIVGLMDLDLGVMREAYARRFSGKPELIEPNTAIVEEVVNKLGDYHGRLKLSSPSKGYEKLLIATGNEVVGMGKIVAGIGYQAYYPITPAADESLFLEQYMFNKEFSREYGSIVVLQTEDELAAINSAIGAALVGVRSSTTTSGPGFSLMAEGLTWAGMNEVPIVITLYQRGGPATGLPTRGSQSELLFTVFAGHGEYARVVISSSDHLEAFYDTIKAFNIAEKYQVPVIHLLDKFLANMVKSIPVPDPNSVEIVRSEEPSVEPSMYKRFDLSKTVSPRAVIGDRYVMWYTGDEHDEYGHISEDPVNRVKMYSKRIRKLELIDKETPVEDRVRYYGVEKPDYLIVGWGSVKGPVLGVLESLKSEGVRAGYLDVKMLHPLPRDYVSEIIREVGVDNVIAVEHSYNVQIADLIALNTGLLIRKRIGKFTGRPIYRFELLDGVKKIIGEEEERVVLSYGA